MKSLRLQLLVGIGVVAAASLAAIWLGLPPDEGQPVTVPLESSATVLRVGAEDWAELVTTRMPSGDNWVLLPATPATAEEFRSDQRGEQRGFVSAESCRECHESYYETWQHTGHAKSSSAADSHSILGSFADGRSTLRTGSEQLQFHMRNRDEKYAQVVELLDSETGQTHTGEFAFDIVLGSGRHGQSYLWFDRDYLYQMHVSYLSETDSWVNSPGPYSDGTADFSRPVPPRCLDCHATWAAWDSEQMNRFDRDSLLLGISCVRCHGPGHEHIRLHRSRPDATEGMRIINPATLSVERRNEICAQCHSAGELLGRPFEYRPGTALQEWLEADLDVSNEENADPHSANQLARLMRSRCYTDSDGIACVSCHDPHSSDVAVLESTVATCAECHGQLPCPEQSRTGKLTPRDCVDCHMPPRRDAQVEIQTESGRIQALLRDHLIGVHSQP